MANRKDTRHIPEQEHITARIPKDLADELRFLAASQDRSLAAEIRQALRAHVEAEPEEIAA